MKNTSAFAKFEQSKIELLPPSITMRVGRRRLTLSWRTRPQLPALLSSLLRRSWRRVLAPTLRLSLAAAAVCSAWQAPALADVPVLPTGWKVINGDLQFTVNGNVLHIDQTSMNAIAKFKSFSIGEGAVVDISQPGAAAAFLAKVTGGDISQIYGTLKAPGTVILFNPNGVMVGSTGVVDVGRFVATTLNISKDDFLAGKMTFTKRRAHAGAVENYGNITSATGGSVYLIGSSVTNGGIIRSPQGEVILAAGQSVTLADTATPGVTVNVTGNAGNVTNLGTITAEAGRIGIAAGLINNSGNISASSVVREGGRIFLRASSNLTTTANSSITADGTTGGNITLFADNKAYIDGDVSATGSAGKGGFVETSGLGSLDVVKVPTVGSGGTWYIDPYDLTVVAGLPGVGNSDVTFCGTNAVSSSGSSSFITNGTINTLLALNTSVYLATGTGGSAGGGNITLNADIFSGGFNPTLSLNADRSIIINSNIDAGLLGPLNLDLRTNYNGNVTGSHDVLVNGGSIKLNGGTFNVSDGSSQINGNSGNGNLSILAGGTLELGSCGTLNAGNVSIMGGSTLNITSNGNVTAGNLTVDGLNSLVKMDMSGAINAGNVTLGVNGKVDLGQGGTINAGNLSIAAHGNLTSSYQATVNLTGTLENNGNLTLQNSVFNAATFNTTASGISTLSNVTGTLATINNAGQLELNNIFLTFSSTSLTNLIGGTLKMHGGLGGTGTGGGLQNVVNQGNMQVYDATGLTAGPISNMGNGTLSVSNSSITAESLYNDGGATMTLGTGSTITAGAINSYGTINVSGLLTTNVDAVNNNGRINALAGANWTVGGNFNNYANLSVASGAQVNGSGETLLSNSGILTLDGGSVSYRDIVNGLTGSITGNGTLSVVKGFVNNGILTPGGTGTIGSLTIQGTGGFTQNDSGEMRIDVGAAPGTDNNTDQIIFNTSYVHLGGTLRTGLINNYQPALGDSFEPFTLVHGIASLDNSYFHTVTGDVRKVDNAKQMLKATYGDENEGMKLTMLGAATFYARGSGDWVDRDSWSGSATNPDIGVGYLPTQIDNVVINNVTASHGQGTDTVDSLTISGTGRLNVGGGDLNVLTGSSFTDTAQLSLNGANVSLGATSIANGTRLFVNGGNMNMTNAAVNGEIDLSSGNLTLAGTTTGSGYISMTSGGGEEGGFFNGFYVGEGTSGPTKTLNMANALSDLKLQIMDGDFNYTGSVRVANMSVYSGNVTGTLGSQLNVAENFYQGGGNITVDSAAFSTGQDWLTFGNITANNLVLEARNGQIVQSGGTSLHVRKQLIASAVTGIDLGKPGYDYGEGEPPNNYIAAFAANNSGSGDITLINHLNTDDASVVTINGVKTANGNVNIENYGGMRTAAIGSNADFLGALPMSSSGSEASAAAKLALLGINSASNGKVETANGTVSLATHSPLTIGIGGVSASGDIILTAGSSAGTNDNLVINGLVQSLGGNINLTAGDNMTINANISTSPPGFAIRSVLSGAVIGYAQGVTITDASGVTTPVPIVNLPSSGSGSSSSSVISQQAATQQNQQTQSVNSVTQTAANLLTTQNGAAQQVTTTTTTSNTQTVGGTTGSFGDESGQNKQAGKKPLPMCT